jgi:Cysteine-rich secretory protein family
MKTRIHSKMKSIGVVLFAATLAVSGVVNSPQSQAAGSGYTALSGFRVSDSRSTSPFSTGETRTISIAGSGSVPVSATAVVLNVTAVSKAAGGYLTVWPTGQPKPETSNVNFGPNDIVPNAVVVQLGSGSINIFSETGPTDVFVDVGGYFEGGFVGVAPARLLDTRRGTRIAGGAEVSVKVIGVAGIPTTGVAGVMLNVTAVAPAAEGYASVRPEGSAVPNASNLNFTQGIVVANAVGVGVGSNGNVRLLHASPAPADYIVDIFGYFETGSFVSLSPTRVFDSRKGAGGKGAVRDGESYSVQIAGVNGVPSTGIGAVLANVTVAAPTRGGYLSMWPNGVSQPNTSVLNFSANQTKPNLTVLTLGNGGAINLFNSSGSTQILIDVLGYFPGNTSTSPAAMPPVQTAGNGDAFLNDINNFRASGRQCNTAGFYSAASRLKWDDTLAKVARDHANAMASAGLTLGNLPSQPTLETKIISSEYRGYRPWDGDWFVFSGVGLTFSAALGNFATQSTPARSYCSLFYANYEDVAIGTASSAGRNYFAFLLDDPSTPSTFSALSAALTAEPRSNTPKGLTAELP